MSSYAKHQMHTRRGLIILLASIGWASIHLARAQNLPFISGGGGLITSTNGGNTTYLPIIAPSLVAPLGDHLLVESRASIVDSFFPRGNGQPGYKHDAFLGLSYLQADVIANRNLTLVAGEFLTPFGTYNERLIPIWISNFEDAPLIFSLGTMSTASSVGGMLRGSAFSSDKVDLDYAAYFSVASTNQQFNAERSTGGRASVYLPNARLEAGLSVGRLLQGTRENYIGTHLWWEPAQSNLRLRSEYARGPHAQGYWVEADYRCLRFHGENSMIGRFEPVLRVQQTFRSQPDSEDGLPAADTQKVDFALDYHLPHEVRINTSYSRQLSSTGNRNIWQTGIVYRFLIPTWRGR
jgi:hypothetical protein